jgi:starch synthase
MPIFRLKKSLKILFVGAEAAPFARVGGVGSVMYSLPKALSELGHDARVMIPRYLSIEDSKFSLMMEHKELRVPTGNEGGPDFLICNVKKCDPGVSGGAVTTYFLENQEYYEQRANVYGYADDTTRWALLCKGVLEFIKTSSWVPDIIVCLDWQAGLLPNYIKTIYKSDPILSKIATVFSIHNLFFQGMFDHHFVSEMDFDDGHSDVPSFNNPRLTKVNFVRRGIIYADSINTVSPNYAREIMTKEYGELLDELLRERKAVLSGILNGIDSSIWDPSADKYINFQYNSKNPQERLKNKVVLQERFGLPVNKDAFVISIVGRLVRQKGLDLLTSTIEVLLQELPLQLVVVGCRCVYAPWN